MLTLASSIAALLVASENGRVEVEGLIITARAKPVSLLKGRLGGNAEYELELSVSAKDGKTLPQYRFDSPPRIGSTGDRATTRSGSSGFYVESGPGGNRWRVRGAFGNEPPNALPAVEGSVSVTPADWLTAAFEGDALRPNGIVAVKEGQVKLVVLDLDDQQPEVRFRIVMTGGNFPSGVNSGARATLTDAEGVERALISTGGGLFGSITRRSEYMYDFRCDRPLASAPKKLLLEVPTPKGPSKIVNYRIPEVPIEATKEKKGTRE